MNHVLLAFFLFAILPASANAVSDEIIVPASDARIFETPGGEVVLGSYLVVGLKDSTSSLDDAKKLAKAYQSPLMAFIHELGWAQIGVSVNNLDELERLAKHIEKHSLVEFVIIDSKSPPPYVDPTP